MKIQTTARIERFSIDGNNWQLPEDQHIDLEFSAIDTGGGFNDPILDFSFAIENPEPDVDGNERLEFVLDLRDPQKEDNTVTFSFEGPVTKSENNLLIANGRLREDQLSDELIRFVMKRLR